MIPFKDYNGDDLFEDDDIFVVDNGDLVRVDEVEIYAHRCWTKMTASEYNESRKL